MEANNDRNFWVLNAVLSTAAIGFLGWLLLINRGSGGADLGFMPGVNACLNAAAATLLALGYRAIRNGNKALHMRLMVSAFACSAVFLLGYVIYHYTHGDTPYQGVGPIRIMYFAILISHVALSLIHI